MSIPTAHPASFRDPSGYIFTKDNITYRRVHHSYADNYELLYSSGLYQQLTGKNWLIEHDEVVERGEDSSVYKILKPRQLGFINYPYEWSFSQYRDAALLTLNIQQLAMTCGMSLKDATPFNVVFEGNRPVFIDSLSFEKYDNSKPWVAYRQFCETFLAPLLLSSYHQPDLSKLMILYPDGIPLSICASILPFSSRFNSLSSLHIHLQAGIKGPANKSAENPSVFTAAKLNRILSHLASGISSLQLTQKVSTWSDYYSNTILQDNYLKEKEILVSGFIDKVNVDSAIDLGANTGQFSIMLDKKGKKVIAIDIDPLCIERLYIYTREKQYHVTPVVADLMNLPPALGWNNRERPSLLQRLNADLVLALALVHHLCIGKNLPFEKLAEMVSQIGRYLIIEFVPKEDEKVRQLLSHREDIFIEYNIVHFRSSFEQYFNIIESKIVGNSGRTLFLMKKKNG